MTPAIYTTELTAANAHLMPWRTVLEVAGRWRDQGIPALVFSGGGEAAGTFSLDGVPVVPVARPKTAKGRAEFARILHERGVTHLYFPVAPGPVNGWVRGLPARAGIAVNWYVPGAWYSLQQVLAARKHLPPRAILPYLVQALWPASWWVRRLQRGGNAPLIAMTEFTAAQVTAAGYSRARVHVIPPGKDAPAVSGNDTLERFARLEPRVKGEPYFLFFGPPNPIRGVFQMIAAFERFAAASPAGKLVCLFRADGNIDPRPVRQLVERTNLQGRLIAVWESVNRRELDAFLEHCRAVLKPFLIVPSEIPLAVIETAGSGKPVIGFGPDGTGAFIDRFGLTARHGDIQGLADAMQRLMTDEALYRQKCQAARNVYEQHPTWREVAQKWLEASASQL